jgi:Ca2+/Na+ antiporter
VFAWAVCGLGAQALFSMRLALRGGENAVEETIKRVRGEYQVALFGLMLGIELFLNCVPFLVVWKLSPVNAAVSCAIIYPCVVLVVFLYKRSESKFYLDTNAKFGSSKVWTVGFY